MIRIISTPFGVIALDAKDKAEEIHKLEELVDLLIGVLEGEEATCPVIEKFIHSLSEKKI